MLLRHKTALSAKASYLVINLHARDAVFTSETCKEATNYVRPQERHQLAKPGQQMVFQTLWRGAQIRFQDQPFAGTPGL
jgi:hypothetical protein